MSDPTDLPRGTVTFLFTDIVGSTGLWEAHGQAMPAAYARHDALLRGAIEGHGGAVYKTIGDAFQAAFPSAVAAVAATLAAQRALAAEPWDLPVPLRIRTVLHTCEIEPDGGDYRSPHLNRLGRLLAVGHGGQILLSAAVEELTRGALPAGAGLRDLGERRLKDLAQAERVFQLLHPDLADDFPPLRTLDYRPHNLPVQLTPFVGRERELAAVRERLVRGDVRLLTLTGPGGIGKTRLSLQAAAELLERFADGVFFVPLDAVADPDLVASAIAEAVGIQEAGDQPLRDALREHLGDRELLLVLDNFEQVVAAAPLLADLLAACRRLKLLVTSRQTLHLHGEHEYAVPPLGLPSPTDLTRRLPPDALAQFEAVRLFVDRAQAAKADFRLTPDNASAVAAICAELDGLPLAIELAAARVKLLPPQAMLARLEKRLALLTGGARDRSARQQTLRGAIAWSHDLLAAEERALFRRLAVFAGGCSFEAVEAVANREGDLDAFDGIASLVDKSLLRQEETADGDPRFAMLATMREFGLEQLDAAGEAATIRGAHGDHFLALAEEAEPRLTGADQAAWLARLEAEHGNLRAALGWLLAQDPGERTLRLAGALWRFWYIHGHLTEGRSWLERALAQADGAPAAATAKAQAGAGLLAQYQGDYSRAALLHEQALDLHRQAGDRKGMSASLSYLGLVATDLGDYEAAERRFQEGLALVRELRNDRAIGTALMNLGMVAFLQGAYGRAAALYEESLRLVRPLGDRQLLASDLVNLAEARDYLGDVARAVPLYNEALAHFRALGDKQRTAFALASLGRVARLQGDFGRAGRLFAEGMDLSQEVGDRATIAACIEGLAALAVSEGDPRHAARLFGAAEALREQISAPLGAGYRPEYDRLVAMVRAGLDEAAFATAWEEGRAFSLDQAADAARRSS